MLLVVRFFFLLFFLMCDPEIDQVNFSHQYDVKIRRKKNQKILCEHAYFYFCFSFCLCISHLSPNGFGSLSQIVHSQQKLQQQIYFTTSTNYTEKKGTLYFIIRAIPFIKDSESQNLTRRGGYFRCKKTWIFIIWALFLLYHFEFPF